MCTFERTRNETYTRGGSGNSDSTVCGSLTTPRTGSEAASSSWHRPHCSQDGNTPMERRCELLAGCGDDPSAVFSRRSEAHRTGQSTVSL